MCAVFDLPWRKDILLLEKKALSLFDALVFNIEDKKSSDF
jgi:hypothetical protein